VEDGDSLLGSLFSSVSDSDDAQESEEEPNTYSNEIMMADEAKQFTTPIKMQIKKDEPTTFMLNDNELSGLNNQSHHLPSSPKARLFDSFKSE